MSWKREKVDVNNGANGERWIGRAEVKARSKLLRRRWSKLLARTALYG